MSKIKDLKEKNPHFNIDLVQMLSERDPSGTNKYLPFMINTSQEFVKVYFNTGKFMDQSFVQLLQLVTKFEQYAKENLLKEKDIYAYASIEDIEQAVKDADVVAELRNVKTAETLVLFEDADRILVKPLTKRSSAIYGKNTKWCTSENDGGSFHSYADEGPLMYFIFKHPPANLPEQWRKLAFNRQRPSADSIIWNAPDKQITSGDAFRIMTIVGPDVMGIINTEFDLCIPNTSLRKELDGTIQINKDLFQNELHGKRRKEIETYVATLKGNRDKKVTTPKTFTLTDDERKMKSKTLEGLQGGELLMAQPQVANFGVPMPEGEDEMVEADDGPMEEANVVWASPAGAGRGQIDDGATEAEGRQTIMDGASLMKQAFERTLNDTGVGEAPGMAGEIGKVGESIYGLKAMFMPKKELSAEEYINPALYDFGEAKAGPGN